MVYLTNIVDCRRPIFMDCLYCFLLLQIPEVYCVTIRGNPLLEQTQVVDLIPTIFGIIVSLISPQYLFRSKIISGLPERNPNIVNNTANSLIPFTEGNGQNGHIFRHQFTSRWYDLMFYAEIFGLVQGYR